MMHTKTIIGFVLVAAVAATAVAFAGGEKVTICHIPQGNPENAQTITIGAKAAAKHFEEHEGDYKGECGKKVTEEMVCAEMTKIVESYVAPEEKISLAVALAADVEAYVARYSPTTADLYYTKATADQQTKVQEMMVGTFTKSACGEFCNGVVDPKTGAITCDGASYVGVMSMSVDTVIRDLTK